MLTKKVVVDQFVVEYAADGQTVTYLETVEIFEDGSFLGKLSPTRKAVPIVNASELYSEISLGPWSPETEYTAGSIVQSESHFWQALQTSTGEAPSESAFWTQLPEPSETEQIVESIQKVSSIYVQDIIMEETASVEDLASVSKIVPEWAAWKKYYKDDIVHKDGQFYQAITGHTSQPTWMPETAVALWNKIHMGDTVPAWSQPLGAHDAYPAGFKVTHNLKTWTSDVDANVWEPGVSGWTEVVAEPPAPETPQPWVQPTGAHDAYAMGATVTHNGSTWTSDVNSNTWEPGVYGWTEVV